MKVTSKIQELGNQVTIEGETAEFVQTSIETNLLAEYNKLKSLNENLDYYVQFKHRLDRVDESEFLSRQSCLKTKNNIFSQSVDVNRLCVKSTSKKKKVWVPNKLNVARLLQI